jgi:mRNA-degrading endonuclease toxin of MazEF toxin-antitoxin module
MTRGTGGRTRPQAGEIWEVNIPDDPHSPRPAIIVVSTNGQNNNLNLHMVVPVSSLNEGPANPRVHVAISRAEGAPDHDSFARCELISTLPRSSFIRKFGGPVDGSKRRQIINAMRFAIGDPSVLKPECL